MNVDKVFEIAHRCSYDLDECGDCPYDNTNCRDGLLGDLMTIAKRLMNCANGAHREVCRTVVERKTNRANDYTPCGHWMMADDA